MANFKEFLLATLAGTLEVVGETKLVEILQQLHDKDEVQYWNAIEGGRVIVKSLLPIAAKSKSPIDDAILQSLSDAIETSAAANAITE